MKITAFFSMEEVRVLLSSSLNSKYGFPKTTIAMYEDGVERLEDEVITDTIGISWRRSNYDN